MSIDFASASYRAASSDLAVSISPLGLVELSDEEFEVHGPRLNRYAYAWAFYLGHHWGYRREVGEPQLTFNYVQAMADWTNNFVFGEGVHFRSPPATEAIIPQLLQRVWDVDNSKTKVLWEMGQTGGVTGDCFVKVAYEEPWVSGMDAETGQRIPGVIQQFHPGRVRILPLNPAHCFPTFAPHDKSRMLEFKLRYRFWGVSMEGTRAVYTYTERITDAWIEEYINDQMIDSRPNPLGRIPIVHIPNTPVSGSPWGLSDIGNVIPLNREYNEKATDLSDIINYHASPVTVITGAKASQLEKGPKKVWGGLPKDAQVFNLALGENLSGPLAYLDLIKRSMHETSSVPEGALGQQQPISNTSGVALAIQYQPAMRLRKRKLIQYEAGLKEINEIVILTLAIKEPLSLQYDPMTDADETLPDGALRVLDPSDPVTYITTCEWPEPLPVDRLIKLNEILTEMNLGLESKRGALRKLGYEFPDEKMAEIFAELIEDAMDQGTLDMLRAQVAAAVQEATGLLVDGAGGVVSAGGAAVTGAGAPAQTGPQGGGGGGEAGAAQPVVEPSPEVQQLMSELVTRAYGTKLPQRRNPVNEPD